MKLFCATILLLLATYVSGQQNYYANPVKIPVLLSANFGELRPNHFHSGLDIKIQGKSGLPVYAAAEGYISRIVVSPVGLGKSIYINHPNNTTTVYGHLEKFRNDIASYVTNLQYKDESFSLDYKPGKGEFLIKKGDLIAYGGNSGSSAGPHLHFEIRNTDSQNPVNPLVKKIRIDDKTAPVIYSIYITPLDENSTVNGKNAPALFPATIVKGKKIINKNLPVKVSGNIGIAVEANDKITGSVNKCGIYIMKMLVDKKEVFSYKMDEFSFNESRYINSHIVYSELLQKGRYYQKCWIEPGNMLSVYGPDKNKGLSVKGGETKKIQISVTDANQNRASFEFTLKGTDMGPSHFKEDYTALFRFDKNNRYSTETCKIEIPENTLYTDIKFRFKKLPALSGLYSNIYEIHDKETPLHQFASLKIKPSELPDSLIEKAVLVKIDKTSGKETYIGGKYDNGWMSASVREFGNFAVSADNIKPSIRPLNLKNNKLTEPGNLKFKVSDNLSGIAKIKATLDGKWMLFDYDPKNNLIIHYFDNKRFEYNKKHQFILEVTDNKGNKAVYESSFQK